MDDHVPFVVIGRRWVIEPGEWRTDDVDQTDRRRVVTIFVGVRVPVCGPDRDKSLGTVLGQRLIGLRDAVTDLSGDPINLWTLRRAARCDDRAPRPVDERQGERLYDFEQLAAWKAG